MGSIKSIENELCECRGRGNDLQPVHLEQANMNFRRVFCASHLTGSIYSMCVCVLYALFEWAVCKRAFRSLERVRVCCLY